ncbi:MAG: 6-phosphofructokinase [Armatimonadota bacterium]
MADAPEGNAVIGQSGGPTSVINASLVGAVEQAKKHDNIGRMYGALNGIEGVLHERMVDLETLDDEALGRLRYTPSAAIGSVRLKVTDRDLERALDVFAEHNIRYFFYAGGNDSQKTSLMISEAAAARDYDLVCIGIPKTIDNDLPETDHCPGYGSVARFVASAECFANRDNAALRDIHVAECMGRDSGWITAARRLARQDESDGPHMILLPEVPFVDEKFYEDVRHFYHKYGRCMIAASEGIRYYNEDGTPGQRVAQASAYTDAFGHEQLGGVAEHLGNMLEDKLGYKVRSDKHGVLNRCFMYCASAQDLEEAYEVGRKAVELAAEGETGQMVTIVRTGRDPYEWTTGLTEFENVAEKKRDVPKQWIAENDIDVDEDFVEYLRPLVRGEEPDRLGYGPDLPHYPLPEMPRVERKLGDYVDSRGWWYDGKHGRFIRGKLDENTEWSE